MDKKKIRDSVKSSRMLFYLYRGMGSFATFLCSRLVPIKRNKCFFMSFGGRRYDDSPKAIYEEMLATPETEGFSYVWAFVGEGPADIPGAPRIVKTDTLAYFYHLFSSELWVTNASAERGLKFKRNGNISVNTWHGTAIKRIGHDNKSGNKRAVPAEGEKFDMLCAQSPYDQRIFSNVFNVPESKVPITGLPRNDALKSYTEQRVDEIKQNLGIDSDKKVLLYTPTFREYLVDESGSPYLKPPITVEKWKRMLVDRFVVLVRGHYTMTNGLGLEADGFMLDVSDYEPLNDLYAISDAMISDYSSTFIDYSILGRPMYCFAYDFEEYSEKRGLYKEIFNDFPCAIDKDEDSLLARICTGDHAACASDVLGFSEKYAMNAGKASRLCVQEILRVLAEKRNSHI